MDCQVQNVKEMYCRLCLKKNVEVQDINTSKLKCAELTLIESLYWIFGVEVDIDDNYSKCICVRCENVVQYVGSYRTLYQSNQLELEGKLAFQYDVNEGFERQVTDQQINCNDNFNAKKSDSDLVPKKLVRFIDYYYKFPTTALQELMKGSKINNHKLKETVNDSLVDVNGTVNVLVCEYCSQIFARKKQLKTHYISMHKLSDTQLKPKITERQSVKMFKVARRQFKYKQTVIQKHGVGASKNRLILPKKSKRKFLFDIKYFPNLNFIKQLEKHDKEASASVKNSSNEEIIERTSSVKDATAFVESEVRNRYSGANNSNESEYSDGEMSTVKINDDYQTVSEETTRQFINDRYKWLNLKSVCISIEKCVLPTQPHNSETVNNSDSESKEEEISSSVLDLSKIKAITEKLNAYKNRFVNLREEKASAQCDDEYMQISDEPLEVEEVKQNEGHSLKEKYKHLNLKECYVYVKKCAIPTGYSECIDVGRKRTEINLLKKSQVYAEKQALGKMKQWRASISTAILRTRQLCSKSSTNLGNEQNQQTVPLRAEIHPAVSNIESEVKTCDYRQGADHTKWPYLKKFCIAVERCAVPTNFVNTLETVTKETELLGQKHKGTSRLCQSVIVKSKSDHQSYCTPQNITLNKHSYCIKRQSRAKRKGSSNKRKIRKRCVDVKKLSKNLEIVIPALDPNLIKCNIVASEHQQEIANEVNDRSRNVDEDIPQVQPSPNMPVLEKEAHVDLSENVLDKPTLLKPQVPNPPLSRKGNDIEQTETQLVSCNITSKASYTKKIQTTKEEALSRSLNFMKISDNLCLHNQKFVKESYLTDKEKTEVEACIFGKKLSVEALNECHQPIDFKTMIQSRWSDITKDNTNITSEILETGSSNVDLSSFVTRRK